MPPRKATSSRKAPTGKRASAKNKASAPAAKAKTKSKARELSDDDSSCSTPSPTPPPAKRRRLTKRTSKGAIPTSSYSPSISPTPPPEIKETYRGIEHLPLEVLMIVIGFIGNYLPLVQLVSTSKQIREALLPFVLEKVFFACQWQELLDVASQDFRDRLVKLRLLRPHNLLFEDEPMHLLGSVKSPSDDPYKSPLLPKLRVLKITHPPRLKSGETVSITLPTYSFVASMVAKQAPSLQFITSSLELTECMPTSSHGITRGAWKPAGVGRGHGRRAGQKEPRQPKPVTELNRLSFDTNLSNAVLRGKVLSTLFESLAHISTLRRLDLSVTVKGPVSMRCGSLNVTTQPWYRRQCGLQRLIYALELLPSLEELKVTWDYVSTEACFLGHLTASPRFLNLKKLEISARLSGLNVLARDIPNSSGSQIKELRFALQNSTCYGAEVPSPDPLARSREWASPLFSKLSQLKRVSCHLVGYHHCQIERFQSDVLKKCLAKGLHFSRDQVTKDDATHQVKAEEDTAPDALDTLAKVEA